MPIFKMNNSKLVPIAEKKIDLERDIQKLTEQNLEAVFGLKFVCGASNQEFCVRVNEQDFYIDTVAFDEGTRAVILIEYKKDRSFSVIDQGFAYLSAMLNNKAEFVLEINERLGKNFSKKDIDWEQSRIIFISNEFTNYQKNAINFKDLPMFLYEVKIYDSLVDYNPIKPFKTSESINKFIKDKKVQEVTKEVKVYGYEDLIKPNWPDTKELYLKFEQATVGSIGSKITQVKTTQRYIALTAQNGKNFVEVVPLQKGLKVYFRFPYDYVKSPLEIKDCTMVGHWTNGLSFVEIDSESQIEEAKKLATKSYDFISEKR